MSPNTETVVEFSLSLIGQWPEPMLLMDGERFIEANPAAVRLLGYGDKSALVGRTPDQISPPIQPDGASSAAKARQFFREARQGSPRRFEWVYLDAGGREVDVDTTLSPIRQGEQDIVLCAWHDISWLKRSQEALVQRNLELLQFAHVAAHDLQTPLRTISLFTQLLHQEAMGHLNEQARQWSALVVEGSRRMQSLVEDLLSCARLDGQPTSFAPVDLHQVLEDARANLSWRISETGAEVLWEELPLVMGNQSQLVQVFQNLIENGIKYNTSSAPRITVSARPDGDDWVIGVADNGIGIAPAHRGEIFEMFRRLHTQQEYQGTGIGLAICQRIVERHGGRIWVEAGETGGSVFRMALPGAGARGLSAR
ncbi:MAG: sensor histidine kinase [Actinomycetota bacterium]